MVSSQLKLMLAEVVGGARGLLSVMREEEDELIFCQFEEEETSFQGECLRFIDPVLLICDDQSQPPFLVGLKRCCTEPFSVFTLPVCVCRRKFRILHLSSLCFYVAVRRDVGVQRLKDELCLGDEAIMSCGVIDDLLTPLITEPAAHHRLVQSANRSAH